MKQKNAVNTSHQPERRRFLKTVGLGTVAASATAVVGHVTLAQADTQKTTEHEQTSVNYRETDHVRAYYASLRD